MTHIYTAATDIPDRCRIPGCQNAPPQSKQKEERVERGKEEGRNARMVERESLLTLLGVLTESKAAGSEGGQ
jgi:hypothetical protein